MGNMSVKQSVFKNTFFMLIANVITAALFFGLLIIISRTIGPEGLGVYSFAMAVASALTAFLDLGLNSLTIREVSRKKHLAGKYVSTIFGIRSIASIILLIALTTAFIFFKQDTGVSFAVYGLFIYMAIKFLASSLKIVFVSFERMEYNAIITNIVGFVIVALSSMLLFLGHGLNGVVVSFVVGSIIDFILSAYLLATRFEFPKIEIDIGFWKDTIKKAIPFGVVTSIVAVYLATDIIMLSFLTSEAEVGFYNAAYRVLISPMLMITPFTLALFPVISKHYPKHKEKIEKFLFSSLKFGLAFTLPIAIALMIFSEEITLLFYGEAFASTSSIFVLLAMLAPLLTVNILTANTVGSVNKQKTNMANAAMIFLLNIILNYFFIKEIGFIGAGYATIITQVLFLILSFYALREIFSISKILRKLFFVLSANIIFGVLLLLMSSFSVFTAVPIAIIIYIVLIWILKANVFEVFLINSELGQEG